MIDLGSTKGLSPISYLHGKNVGYMVITHPHHDHFSDILNIGNARPTVLYRCHDYTRGELMTGILEQQKATFEAYCNFVESYTADVEPGNSPKSGVPLMVYVSMRIQLLFVISRIKIIIVQLSFCN